ncbi:unnamed protein product [Kuraishia capsulata CBS 1993]|uniref:Mss4-like protein n=1 Tax=Kuraishia capsulata CBS 1993 TaxID=1382522 RepID=W6MUY9_9ASCO|nr:uncharacterized protein KUCA_T00005655001 [Kuraishia capsulata CBS 1993]CDK29662.1 unnamed protein product [Kuraishia capsulata CBS 1993]
MLKYQQLKQSKPQSAILRCSSTGCNCRILEVKDFNSDLQSNDFPLTKITNAPKMPQTIELGNEEALSDESQGLFYSVDDMWSFDNIGVSKTTEKFEGTEEIKTEAGETIYFQRYLICADCDRGPIGFAGYLGDAKRSDDGSGLHYFIHPESVRYEIKR